MYNFKRGFVYLFKNFSIFSCIQVNTENKMFGFGILSENITEKDSVVKVLLEARRNSVKELGFPFFYQGS
jgi:hypothetical protein